MASANRYPGLDERIVAVVRYHAKLTAACLSDLDVEDAEQELLLHLHRRLPAFRPERASLATFADRIARRHGATMVAAARARRRCPEGRPLSLSAPTGTADGEELAGTIASDRGLWPGPCTSTDELVGMRHDLSKLLRGIAPPMRRLCAAMADGSVADAIVATGRARSSVYEMLQCLRTRSRELGLDVYLGPSRTVSDPAR